MERLVFVARFTPKILAHRITGYRIHKTRTIRLNKTVNAPKTSCNSIRQKRPAIQIAFIRIVTCRRLSRTNPDEKLGHLQKFITERQLQVFVWELSRRGRP